MYENFQEHNQNIIRFISNRLGKKLGRKVKKKLIQSDLFDFINVGVALLLMSPFFLALFWAIFYGIPLITPIRGC